MGGDGRHRECRRDADGRPDQRAEDRRVPRCAAPPPPPSSCLRARHRARCSSTAGGTRSGRPIPYGSKVNVTDGRLTLKTELGTVTVYGGGVSGRLQAVRLAQQALNLSGRGSSGRSCCGSRLLHAAFVCLSRGRVLSALADHTQRRPARRRRSRIDWSGTVRVVTDFPFQTQPVSYGSFGYSRHDEAVYTLSGDTTRPGICGDNDGSGTGRAVNTLHQCGMRCTRRPCLGMDVLRPGDCCDRLRER